MKLGSSPKSLERLEHKPGCTPRNREVILGSN